MGHGNRRIGFVSVVLTTLTLTLALPAFIDPSQVSKAMQCLEGCGGQRAQVLEVPETMSKIVETTTGKLPNHPVPKGLR